MFRKLSFNDHQIPTLSVPLVQLGSIVCSTGVKKSSPFCKIKIMFSTISLVFHLWHLLTLLKCHLSYLITDILFMKLEFFRHLAAKLTKRIRNFCLITMILLSYRKLREHKGTVREVQIIEPSHEIMVLFVPVNSFFKRACTAIQWG